MKLSHRILHQIANEVYCYFETDCEVTEVLLCSELFDNIFIDGEVVINEEHRLIFNINKFTSENVEGYSDVIINRYDDMDCMISFEEM
ncbi:hypothetical protein ABH961_005760 [Bacillus sp. RC251]